MSVLLATLAIGLVMAVLALGVFISFRVLGMADITADGSFTLGAAVVARLMLAGWNPWLATVAGTVAGALAGLLTGTLATRFRINTLLSGILVMTALYSVDLRIMGTSNLALPGTGVFRPFDRLVESAAGAPRLTILGRDVAAQELGALLGAAAFAALVAGGLAWYLRTESGAALRATGDNPRMLRALGTSTDRATVIGLAMANALVALSGALLAQMQGFADVQMGIGMIVMGLASVILGQTLVGNVRIGGVALVGAVMGSVLFRLMIAIALRWGLDPNDLKLVTAAVVFAAIVLPGTLARWKAVPRA
jgi:putative ABC transport system permease protein